MNEPAAPRIDAVGWRAAVADLTAVRFGEITEPDLVLEGSVFAHPITGTRAVHVALGHSAEIYAQMRFTEEMMAPDWTILAFDGTAFGLHISGVTVLALGPSGRVRHVALYHRPLSAVLRFSAELGDRLSTSPNGSQKS